SSSALDDKVVDAALGLPDASEGGVTATSSRRIPGGLANRAIAAIDGDPDTWWSPGFLGQRREYVDYVTAEPITVDRLALTVLNDGRHSVPRVLQVAVGDSSGEDQVQEVTLPAIDDQEAANASHTFNVRLDRPASGTHVRVTVADRADAVREVQTLDWITGRSIVMPIGIVELGIEGLTAPPLPARMDVSCRPNLVEVDGTPVPVSLRGTTADMLAGRAVEVVACPTEALSLPAGRTTLRTTAGSFTGLDLDRVVLRSAAGGRADVGAGTIVTATSPGAGRPDVRVDREGRTKIDLTVTGADDAFWLVLGQSHNTGWTATADGKDLGEPILVDGYANGWEVPPGQTISVHLEWTPQKVVWAAVAASVLFVLLALALVAWPRRAGAGGEDDQWLPLDARPSMAQPFRFGRLLRYAGPAPSRFALVATVAASLLLGAAAIGPVPGLALAAAAVLALRVPRSRPLLTIGGPLLLAGSAGFLVFRQLVSRYPTGFDWPTYYEVVHQPAWTAVAMIALDVVVDRCWLRRWWPTEDSPT
ncbi:MAG: hypothetical protein H0U29_06095, partial [Acidimicrobiia bacterium]|nr:hypothetical protein [Acidimicrobiia bacterium]